MAIDRACSGSLCKTYSSAYSDTYTNKFFALVTEGSSFGNDMFGNPTNFPPLGYISAYDKGTIDAYTGSSSVIIAGMS